MLPVIHDLIESETVPLVLLLEDPALADEYPAGQVEQVFIQQAPSR